MHFQNRLITVFKNIRKHQGFFVAWIPHYDKLIYRKLRCFYVFSDVNVGRFINDEYIISI